jgi:hypothetical protein
LSVWTATRARLHRLFRCEARNARKRPETGRPGVDFKPIQTPFRLTAKTACNYTKWPEVKRLHQRRRRVQEEPSRPPSGSVSRDRRAAREVLAVSHE